MNDTTDPRLTITAHRRQQGQALQVTREIDLTTLDRAKHAGDVLMVEIHAALKELRSYRALTSPPPQLAATDLAIETRKVRRYQTALNLAIAMLAPREPPDSRAVSDEFVALCVMQHEPLDERAWETVKRGLDRYPKQET